MTRRERFVCLVTRDEEGRIRAIELQRLDLEQNSHRVSINGSKAPRIAGPLYEILRRDGLKGRRWTSSQPLDLSQVTGAHAELLLSAVKPLRRGDRVDRVAEGIAAMSREEASYWHAKSGSPGGLPALRVLLIGAQGK